MKKIIKWILIVLGVVIIIAFFAFLYFIPPLTLLPPEEFSKPVAAAGPATSGIADPRERMLAERGRYLVMTRDCSGCHTPVGDQGEKWDEFLAGGNTLVYRNDGTFVTRNLTPDKETGLARRSDDEVRRTLRTGLLADGRIAPYHDMPWAAYSNLTEEDRYAIMVYLRHLDPIYHKIPDDNPAATTADDPAASETFLGRDVAGHKAAPR